jgi:hypothetical protein
VKKQVESSSCYILFAFPCFPNEILFSLPFLKRQFLKIYGSEPKGVLNHFLYFYSPLRPWVQTDSAINLFTFKLLNLLHPVEEIPGVEHSPWSQSSSHRTVPCWITRRSTSFWLFILWLHRGATRRQPGRLRAGRGWQGHQIHRGATRRRQGRQGVAGPPDPQGGHQEAAGPAEGRQGVAGPPDPQGGHQVAAGPAEGRQEVASPQEYPYKATDLVEDQQDQVKLANLHPPQEQPKLSYE